VSMFGGGVFGGGGGVFGSFGAQDAEAGDASASRPHVTTASIMAGSSHSQAGTSFTRQKPQAAEIPDVYAIVSTSTPAARSAVRQGAVTPPPRPPAPPVVVRPIPPTPRATSPRLLVAPAKPAPAPVRPVVPAAPAYTGWKPPAQLPAPPVAPAPVHGFGDDASVSTGAKVVLVFAAIGVLAVTARLLDI
jgi:hypothetical protein